MTSLKNAIHLQYIYLTLKQIIIIIETYQYEHHFMLLILIYFNLSRKVFFDYNTCIENWVPSTGNCDSHWLIFLIWGWNHSIAGCHCPYQRFCFICRGDLFRIFICLFQSWRPRPHLMNRNLHPGCGDTHIVTTQWSLIPPMYWFYD